MKFNRLLFIGLGGAGQRHLRNFSDLLPASTEKLAFRQTRKTPLLSPGFKVDPSATIEDKYGVRMVTSLEEGLDAEPDLVIISNPTSLHLDVAAEAARRKTNVFIEKPLSHNAEGILDFRDSIIRNDLKFMISYQRRFHPRMKKMREIIVSGGIGKIVNILIEVGSFVPAWHPYEDFRELYACRADLGGGVLLTEIHEVDLCYWFFGLPKAVECYSGRHGGADIDVEDTAVMTLVYEDFPATLQLCFMQQKNRRSIRVAGTEGYLEWSDEDDKLFHHDYKSGNIEDHKEANPFPFEQMFLDQTKYFLSEFDQSDTRAYLNSAIASQLIIDAAKKSTQSGKMINIPIGAEGL